MRRIIDGKIYDTDKAEKLGSFESHLLPGDFGWFRESLFRTEKGAYFLAGKGGPETPYAQPGEHTAPPHSGLRALSEEEAKAWVEAHLSVDDYQEIFGQVEEA